MLLIGVGFIIIMLGLWAASTANERRHPLILTVILAGLVLVALGISSCTEGPSQGQLLRDDGIEANDLPPYDSLQ